MTQGAHILCRACGRRYRWRVQFAGQQIVCLCGEPVLIPKVEPAGGGGAGAVGGAAGEVGAPAVLAAEGASTASASAAAPGGKPIDHLNSARIRRLLEEDFLEEQERGTSAPVGEESAGATPRYCPNCRSFWEPQDTFCLRCGHVLETPAELGDTVLLRDRRVAGIIVAGLVALIFGAAWGYANLLWHDRFPAPWKELNPLGCLAPVLAWLVCWRLSQGRRRWPRMLQVAAFLFTGIGIVLGNARGYGWVDLLWVALAFFIAYRYATRAEAGRG